MDFVTHLILWWFLKNSEGRNTMKWYSNIARYNISNKMCAFSLPFPFIGAFKEFKLVLKDTNLQFKSMLDKIIKKRHKQRKVKDKISTIPIWRWLTSDSDLIGDRVNIGRRKVNVRIFISLIWKCSTIGSDLITNGVGETFIHIYTYKNKRKMNTNFASMNKVRTQRGRRLEQ